MGFSSCLGQVGFYVYWWPSHLQATHPQDPFLSRQVWEQIRLILLQRDLGDHTTGGASHTKALPCIPVNFASTLCFPPLHASWKKQESSRKASISALLSMPKPLTAWITINWKILEEMGIPDHLTCLLRNLYAGKEATVRTGHGTTDWFQIGKGVRHFI